MIIAFGIYFGIGLIFSLIDLWIYYGEHGYTWDYIFDMCLWALFLWPIFLFGLLLILLESIEPKNKNKLKDERHLHNNSQEN